jgi:predicted neuraminidase
MKTNVKRFPTSVDRLLAALGVALIAASAYGLNLSIESAQNIFEQDSGPWSGGHAATIVQTTDGTIIAAWRRDNDRVPNNEAWMSTFQNGRWTLPRIIATGSESGDDFTLENVALFQPKGGPLMLFYYTGPKPVFDRQNMHEKQENMWGVLKTSTDNGVTWSAPRALGNDPRIAGGKLCGPVKNPPLQLPDGTILIPSGNEPGLLKEGGGKLSHPIFENLTWHFEKSTDKGKTWSLVQVLPANKNYKAIQPGFLVLGGGKLIALGRNEGRGSDTPMATSDDWGATWSNISGLAALPQSHSGIAPLTLRDGTHICIVNTPVNPKNPRDQLDLMVSRDGVNWSLGLSLNPAGDGKVANYPQVIQAADGRLHIVFTCANQQNAQTWRERVIRHVVLATGFANRHSSPEASSASKATPKVKP